MGPRESNFGTVAGLHETVTWKVHETVTWKVQETVTWKGRWRSGERGSKRRREAIEMGSKYIADLKHVCVYVAQDCAGECVYVVVIKKM
ncbi:hypothetical protein E2C01_092552 [Portunus trituberculatus]|uniref:Uncharacterized protein n=1 Tax=Portunus trituberculatus TaxID=210409 RepID=A0A5B7JW37_PORTR|nr:hypothetical protein [Portunus trituberculatus]